MAAKSDITQEEIRTALENHSGYPFELEIVRRIEGYKPSTYLVEPNYSFEDHDTGMARELDFRALEALPIHSKKMNAWAFVTILGSCKDNKNPYVFFTRQPILQGVYLDADLPIAGCPLQIFKNNEARPTELQWFLKLHTFLHIATTKKISSQFCELVRKKTWNVQSETIFKDAFIPLIKALSREIEDYNKKTIPKKTDNSPYYTIYYPLIVLKGPIFEYYVPPDGPSELNETKHVVVIRHYESRTVKCKYAIDVIHESYLEEYLKLIENEVKSILDLIKHHKKVIVDSIVRLAEIEEAKGKAKFTII